ncbi:MAG: hypothetical protein COV52_08235 [Gammaproteobacteria bacterium CG11_big_fil_rev_8_21_14_0_20_46_22]|nr:MAG: hypothetical protein COW05_06240 [Gammaproteobacteria bacterium CG12_big_fil_rev_8_21_14_0_65_46_12]PIR10595.1 MAG: hypothetical protein COV52_08235 [Gammaproteobacteria bacterium CG11_big_fil_rev_8_21_14_0_20_46_22]
MEKPNTDLQDSDLFASAFKYAAIGMALVSPDGQFLYVNEALCKMLGYSEKETPRRQQLPELQTGLRDFVLHEAAQCIKFLKKRIKNPFRISINLSPKQLD